MARQFGVGGEVGGGGLPKLAPDLLYPSQIVVTSAPIRNTGNIDTTTGGLVTLLSLTDRSAYSLIQIDGLPLESITLKFTVDGIIILNDTFINAIATNFSLVGGAAVSDTTYEFNSSLLLEVSSTTGTNVNTEFIVRKIV